jgi:DNA-binding NtrC family response regulator
MDAIGERNSESDRTLVGQSPEMVALRETIALAARSRENVLIVGETGVGKELVAHAIHTLAALPRGPFVAHNCATIPLDLFDTTFFGHARGAFTSAHAEHEGLLVQADGGILFLDELECLSPFQQAKLLRVIDDGAVKAVGSNRERRVSARFVAATNRTPEELMNEGLLRPDFFYRIRGFMIAVPPLRKRSADIPELARWFLRDSNQALTSEATQRLIRHSWPGNVRELKNVIRTAMQCATGTLITERDIDLPVSGSLNGTAIFDRCRESRSSGFHPLVSLHNLERQAILQALEIGAGNCTRAAELLGIHRTTLQRKLRSFKRGSSANFR